MKSILYIFATTLFIFGVAGCERSTKLDASAEISGLNDWVKGYQDRGVSRLLIGDSVELVGETDSNFIVNIGGDTELNVPKKTEHLVRIVDKHGFAMVPQDLKDFDSDKAHIDAAIKARAKSLEDRQGN